MAIKDVDGFFNCNPTGGTYVGGYICGAIPDADKLNPRTISGYYTMMAMVLNTAGMPLPGNAEPPLPR